MTQTGTKYEPTAFLRWKRTLDINRGERRDLEQKWVLPGTPHESEDPKLVKWFELPSFDYHTAT